MPNKESRKARDTNIALVGRQPIYGRNVDVFGYELLFRNSAINTASFEDGDAATAQVMLNTFIEIGLDQIVDQHLAFINLTRDFVLGNYCVALPKERVVLEVIENLQVDQELIDALRRLSQQGYRIALDDFVYHESLTPLVELADIIKVDVLELDRKTIEAHVGLLRQYPVKLLAEKVETHEDFEFCRDLGFDYFQGYFFCKPNIIAGKPMPANRMAILALLAQLHDPAIKITHLERILQEDLSVSSQVLRYINSSFFAMPKQVDSINEAVYMVGTERLRTWASLLMLARLQEKPLELLVTAMVRARMCEQLGRAQHVPDPDKYFAVGLFSVLDGVLDQSIQDIVRALPLSEDIRQALTDRHGAMGLMLDRVMAYERGEWDVALGGGEEAENIKSAYLKAISWTSYLLPLLKT